MSNGIAKIESPDRVLNLFTFKKKSRSHQKVMNEPIQGVNPGCLQLIAIYADI